MPAPTEYLPKTFRPRVSTYWWLGRWPYLKFILRELSSVSVAWFVVMTLLQIRALKGGPTSYAKFQEWLRHPVLMVINVIAFFFVVFHAVTWFNLAPQAMVVHLGSRRVPGAWLAAANYLAWALASALLAWLILAR